MLDSMRNRDVTKLFHKARTLLDVTHISSAQDVEILISCCIFQGLCDDPQEDGCSSAESELGLMRCTLTVFEKRCSTVHHWSTRRQVKCLDLEIVKAGPTDMMGREMWRCRPEGWFVGGLKHHAWQETGVQHHQASVWKSVVIGNWR